MKHVVTLNAGAIYIKNSGVVFQIVHDDYSIKETFGKLKVTNTSIEWMPKNTKGKGKGIKLKWKEFDELMKKHQASCSPNKKAFKEANTTLG